MEPAGAAEAKAAVPESADVDEAQTAVEESAASSSAFRCSDIVGPLSKSSSYRRPGRRGAQPLSNSSLAPRCPGFNEEIPEGGRRE